jgi:hypothetical protein
MRRVSRMILFGVLGLCLAGCAGVSYRDVKASLPPLGPDKARITIFRESRFFGSALTFDISIGGAPAGKLPSGSVLTVDHAPGDLFLAATSRFPAMARASMTLSAQPGQEYFVEMGTAPDCGAYAGTEPADDHLVTCLTRSATRRRG